MKVRLAPMRAALLALGLAVLAAPSAAHAAVTISQDDVNGSLQIDAPFSPEENHVVVSRTPLGGFLVVDSAGVSTTDTADCAPTSATQMICNAPPAGEDHDVTLRLYGGNDTVTVDEAGGVVRLRGADGGSGNDDLTGGSGDDMLLGGGDDDTLRGLGGDDSLNGFDRVHNDADGIDDLDGGEGGDWYSGGDDFGPDLLIDRGTTGEDTVHYGDRTNGVSLVLGDGEANDGGVEDELAEGGPRDEVQGMETVWSGAGNDVVVGSDANENLQGFEGDDQLDGAGGDDQLYGAGGDDTLTGGSGIDILSADDGVDHLYARDGAADSILNCGFGSESGETAQLDASDPDPEGCETVDRDAGGGQDPPPGDGEDPPPGGGGPANPGNQTGGSTPAQPTSTATPQPAPEVVIPRECPRVIHLYARTEYPLERALDGKARLTVNVPGAGWTARGLSFLNTQEQVGEGSHLTSSANVVSSRAGLMKVPVVIGREYRLGVRNAPQAFGIGVVVVPPGCPPLVANADLPLTTGKASAAKRRIVARMAVSEISCRDLGLPEPCFSSPPVADEPKCEGYAQSGADIRVIGECLKKQSDGTFTSEKEVRLNGIEIVPMGGKITFDPKAPRISSTGRVRISLPHVTGDTVLYEGGLGIDLRAKELELAEGKLKSGVSLKGFPIKGTVKFKLTALGATANIYVRLPKRFGPVGAGVNGEARVHLDYSGLKLDLLVVNIPDVEVAKKLRLKASQIKYKREQGKDVWTGKTTAELPAGRGKGFVSPQVLLDMKFVDGKFAGGSIKVASLNRPFGAAWFFLQDLGARVELEDTTLIGGEVAFTVGPRVKSREVIELIGDLSYRFSEPGVWTGVGKVNMFEAKLTQSTFKYFEDGRMEFDGRLDFEPTKGFGIHGQLSGNAASTGFNVTGTTQLLAFGQSLNGTARANQVALTACAGSWGGTYYWATRQLRLDGCGLGAFKPLGGTGARASQAAAVGAFDVAEGEERLAVRATGADGPAITLVGPDGTRVNAPVVGPGTTALRSPELGLTLITVDNPRAGRWQVLADGAPPARLELALGQAEARVRGRVRRVSGGRRKLDWRASGLEGRRLRFYEVGATVNQTIGKGSGSTGELRFTPAAGEMTRRQIIAEVEQPDGAPSERIVVAEYDPGDPVVPDKIEDLRLSRTDGKLKIRWSIDRRPAVGFDISVKFADGRSETHFNRPGDETLQIDDTDDENVRVTVRAVGDDEIRGRRATERAFALRERRPKKPRDRETDEVGFAETVAPA